MSKKLLLTGLILSSFIILVQAAGVDAAWVYVGTKIVASENPQGQTFCLPTGTKMSVMSGATVLNQTTTTAQTCVGSTIWSGAVDLTSGTNYGIKLDVSTCEGFESDGKCWYKGNPGSPGQSCTEVCADKGGTASPGCCETDTNCTALNYFGANCGWCGPYCPVYVYPYYNECYNCEYQDWCDCNWQPWDPAYRVCACSFATAAFNYTFSI